MLFTAPYIREIEMNVKHLYFMNTKDFRSVRLYSLKNLEFIGEKDVTAFWNKREWHRGMGISIFKWGSKIQNFEGYLRQYGDYLMISHVEMEKIIK